MGNRICWGGITQNALWLKIILHLTIKPTKSWFAINTSLKKMEIYNSLMVVFGHPKRGNYCKRVGKLGTYGQKKKVFRIQAGTVIINVKWNSNFSVELVGGPLSELSIKSSRIVWSWC